MLKSLRLKNFTVFPDAQLDFGKNLNIIVGTNGSGKTHVLKAAYSVQRVMFWGLHTGSKPTKQYLQSAMAEMLTGVFRPDGLGRLVRRQAGKVGRNRGEVKCCFVGGKSDIEFSFHTGSKNAVMIEAAPQDWDRETSIYLPPRELITLGPQFVAFYDQYRLPFDSTWRDTTALLQLPLAKGPRESKVKELLLPLEKAMGGKVETDSGGRFYLRTQVGPIEMHLVAEGLRKLAMLARLIASGTLLDNGYLFWDEPESNLNPEITKIIARTILEISQSGVQVFIATHSLFLLRELYILQQDEFTTIDSRCFGLHIGEDGAVAVEQGPTIDDIGDITALDEELTQSERFLDTEEKLGENSIDESGETNQ